MKILFIMTTPGMMKYFNQTIRYLMREGHTLHLVFFGLARENQGKLYEKLSVAFPDRSSYETIP